MSGGHFEIYTGSMVDELSGQWRDEELNDLFADLFGEAWNRTRGPFAGRYAHEDRAPRCEFGPRGGGLLESLDFWLSGDTREEDYRADVRRFKDKWFRRTPKNRVEYYQRKFEEWADEIKEKFVDELGRADT